ncbi:MAG: DUF2007 domain-containing protein [Bacteroidaceae bacterium]|nr:DUF2007 domain-containing protein [Bacteroidaceae bacterium]MBR6602019.1 DUF2007 domain-containing protein [Bacteroidaceae bacterium]
MTTTDNGAWVKVFSGAAFETEVVKGLLEANGIRCILEDHSLSALTSHYSGIGGDMCILVSPADEEAALHLIEHKE